MAGLLNDPPPAPPGLADDSPFDDVSDAMREIIGEHLDPQILEDRRTIWAQHAEIFGAPPTWLTLTPDASLECWAGLLQDELRLDPQALGNLVELIRSSRLGYQEGCRILAHLLKDSETGEWRSSSSAWLNRSVNEARQAINDFEYWNLGSLKGKSKGKGGTSGSSSSSTRWAPGGSSWSSAHGGKRGFR